MRLRLLDERELVSWRCLNITSAHVRLFLATVVRVQGGCGCRCIASGLTCHLSDLFSDWLQPIVMGTYVTAYTVSSKGFGCGNHIELFV